MDASALVTSSAVRVDYALARYERVQVVQHGAAAVSLIQAAGQVSSGAPRGAVSPVAGATESGQLVDRQA